MKARLTALLAVPLIAVLNPGTANAQLATVSPAAQPAALSVDAVPPDRWHVVLIAGYNGSSAFDNGVLALRSKLLARGVHDIQALTTDRHTNPTLPLATTANVLNAVQQPGGEACLVFMTSEGATKGLLLLASNEYLGPSSLESALTAGCGTRPTVVVISGCHTGVFLTPAMRQPNRIVLTAAALNRQSNGCDPHDRYTYYDECLLEGIDSAITWRQLSQTMEACVDRTERRKGVAKASQPQAFIGSAVSDLRLPAR